MNKQEVLDEIARQTEEAIFSIDQNNLAEDDKDSVIDIFHARFQVIRELLARNNVLSEGVYDEEAMTLEDVLQERNMKELNLSDEVGHGHFLLWITKDGEDCKYSEHFTLESLKTHLEYVENEYDFFVIPEETNVYKGSKVLEKLKEMGVKNG